MTLFLDVAKEFLIKHIQAIIQESKNAPVHSARTRRAINLSDLDKTSDNHFIML